MITAVNMCHLSTEYCSECNKLVHRTFRTCSRSRDTYVCVDREAYDTNIQFIVVAPNGSIMLDLTKIIREHPVNIVCNKCMQKDPDYVLNDVSYVKTTTSYQYATPSSSYERHWSARHR